jgi:metallopeptidase MepB
MNFNPTPGQLLAAAEERKQVALKAVEKLAEIRAENATFENSILPLIQSENLRGRNDPPIGFLEEVSPSKDVRDASRQAQVLLSDYMQDISTREEIYTVVTAVLRKENDQLDQESKHYLRRQRHSLIENGFSIPKGPQRDRYQAVRKRITALRASINKMSNENKEGVWLTHEQLDGVPERVIRTLPAGDPEGENSGKLWLQLWTSAARTVKSSASSSSTRRRVTVQESYRCSEAAEPMRELLVLRDEAARLLGYSSYAAQQFESYLISTPATLEDFFSEFKSQTLPMVRSTHEELLKVKKAYLDEHPQDAWDTPDKLFIWDFSFYRQISQTKSGGAGVQDVREYFPFETTFPRVLDLLEQCFCIRFERLKTGEDTTTEEEKTHQASPNSPKSLTWHEDVMMFRVWDTKHNASAFLGYLYYDVYKREGKGNRTMCFSLQKVCPHPTISTCKC